MDRMTVWLPRRFRAVARAARACGSPGTRLAVCVGLIVLAGGSAAAQGPSRSRPAPPRPPSFGAESKEAEAPPPILSRGEMLRRFDLNFDGKIDEAEGELGRAKLRREREEEERQRREREEINPLTGRPRSEDGLEKEAEPRKRRIISIDDLLPGNEDSPPNSLPGDGAGERVSGAGRRTASGKEKDESIDPAAAGRSRSGGLLGSKEAPRSAARKPSATPEAGSTRPGIISGGVRAGAPPARPGYGAPSTTLGGGSKSSRPLNAGRPVGSLRPGSSPAKPGATAAGNGVGGQLPARPQTGRPSATQPAEAAPRVPLFPDRPIE